jgi:hypothetical protein
VLFADADRLERWLERFQALERSISEVPVS